MRPGQAVPFSGGAAGRYPPAASTAAPTSAAPCPRPVTANLANFMRTLALPKEVEHCSLTTIREKLDTIGAQVIAQGRYVTLQPAEVAVRRELFRGPLRLVARRHRLCPSRRRRWRA